MHTAITVGFLLYDNMRKAGWLDDEDLFYFCDAEEIGEIIADKVNEFFNTPLYEKVCDGIIAMDSAVDTFFTEWEDEINAEKEKDRNKTDRHAFQDADA